MDEMQRYAMRDGSIHERWMDEIDAWRDEETSERWMNG